MEKVPFFFTKFNSSWHFMPGNVVSTLPECHLHTKENFPNTLLCQCSVLPPFPFQSSQGVLFMDILKATCLTQKKWGQPLSSRACYWGITLIIFKGSHRLFRVRLQWAPLHTFSSSPSEPLILYHTLISLCLIPTLHKAQTHKAVLRGFSPPQEFAFRVPQSCPTS